MAFDTFPLPDLPPNLGQADRAIASQFDALTNVAGALYDAVDSRIAQQQSALGKVRGVITRAVNGRVNKQAAQLAPIQEAVQQAQAEFAGQQAARAALSMSQPAAAYVTSPAATATAAQAIGTVAGQPCPQAPDSWPLRWPTTDKETGGAFWCWLGSISYGFLKPGISPAMPGLTGPFGSSRDAELACPGAETIAQACLPELGGGGTGGGGAGGGGTGGGGTVCPPGTYLYDNPASAFFGGIVLPGWVWNADKRTWGSPANPTCDPVIDVMLPPDLQCKHSPVLCLPIGDSGGGGTGGGGGGTGGTGGGGGGGGTGGGGTGGGGGTCDTACPAPIINVTCPAPVVNVAAPVVNVTCDTGGTGDGGNGQAGGAGNDGCPILVKPSGTGLGHSGGPSGPDFEGETYALPDGTIVGPFQGGLPGGYTLDPAIACPPDCGPDATGSWGSAGQVICVAGQSFDVGGEQQDTLNGPRWGTLDVCKTIDKVNVNAQKAVSSLVPDEVLALLKEDNPDFNGFAKKWSEGAPIYVRWFVEGLVNVFTHGAHYLLHNGMYSGDCAPLAMALPLIVRAIIDSTEKWLGLGLRDTKLGLDYWTNYVCPTTIPGIGEAGAAYLANTIDHDLWRCWVRANNAWDVPAERIVEARRTRPGPSDLIRLHRRNIVLEPEYLERMRGNGVLNDRERELLERSTEFTPGPSDIIAMMKRDVFDEAVVAKYQYDEEFQEKFSLEAQRLAKAAGLPVEIAKLYWRLHWRTPSDSQGFQMLQRLRPGAVDPSLVTTHESIEELLGINDMAPEWRARLIAIAYRRPTSVQARRSYNLFIISKDELIGYILDIGYSPKAAQNLADTWEVDRNEFWAKHRWGKAYIAGAYSLAQLREAMTTFSEWDMEKQRVLNYLSGIVNVGVRQECIKSTKHLFMLGMLTVAGAQVQLINTGTDPAQAVAMTTGWECERNSQGRLIPAAKMCRWYQTGLMATQEFAQRLGALGYTDNDVKRIIGECDSQAKARAQANATKKAVAAEKAAEKAARAAQKTAAKAESTWERDAAKMEKLVGQIAALTGDDVGTVGHAVREKVNVAVAHVPMETSEALKVLADVVAAVKKAKDTDWQTAYDNAVSDVISARHGNGQTA